MDRNRHCTAARRGQEAVLTAHEQHVIGLGIEQRHAAVPTRGKMLGRQTARRMIIRPSGVAPAPDRTSRGPDRWQFTQAVDVPA